MKIRPALAGVAVLMIGCAAFAAEITRPELKCMSPPAYYPGPGILFTEDVANECALLKMDMLRVEFIGEDDSTKSICYDSYDIVVDRAAVREMKILGLIDYASVKYEDQSEWGTPEFRQRFVDRTIEIVTHYSQRENPIRDWEIWNEQDICVTGFCVRIEPEPYAEILTECYEAIKAIDPTATVVFGGISPKNFEYTTNYLSDYYATTAAQAYYAQHGDHPFDVMACHPYPEIFTNPNPGLSNVLNTKIKPIMNANGDGHKKVWLTEMGWSSYYVTEYRQGTYLRDSFLMMDTLTDTTPGYASDGPYVERYFWFCLTDFLYSDADKWGLFTKDMSRKKPAYDRYMALGPSSVTKPILPPETSPPGVAQELVANAGDFTVLPDANDPLNGNVATQISGGFHPVNTDPANQIAAFTDGAGLGTYTGLLLDYSTPSWSGYWVLDQGYPVNLEELRVFSGNANRDGRVFHHYDVYVTNEANPTADSNWTLLNEEVTPARFGTSNLSKQYEATSTRITPINTRLIANAATALRIDFFCPTTIDSLLADGFDPCTLGDVDGAVTAYTASIIYEVDAYFASALPDYDADGDIDQIDFGYFQACLSGPSSPQPLTECAFALLDNDNDVDEADLSIFQNCMSGSNVMIDPSCME